MKGASQITGKILSFGKRTVVLFSLVSLAAAPSFAEKGRAQAEAAFPKEKPSENFVRRAPLDEEHRTTYIQKQESWALDRDHPERIHQIFQMDNFINSYNRDFTAGPGMNADQLAARMKDILVRDNQDIKAAENYRAGSSFNPMAQLKAAMGGGGSVAGPVLGVSGEVIKDVVQELQGSANYQKNRLVLETDVDRALNGALKKSIGRIYDAMDENANRKFPRRLGGIYYEPNALPKAVDLVLGTQSRGKFADSTSELKKQSAADLQGRIDDTQKKIQTETNAAAKEILSNTKRILELEKRISENQVTKDDLKRLSEEYLCLLAKTLERQKTQNDSTEAKRVAQEIRSLEYQAWETTGRALTNVSTLAHFKEGQFVGGVIDSTVQLMKNMDAVEKLGQTNVSLAGMMGASATLNWASGILSLLMSLSGMKDANTLILENLQKVSEQVANLTDRMEDQFRVVHSELFQIHRDLMLQMREVRFFQNLSERRQAQIQEKLAQVESLLALASLDNRDFADAAFMKDEFHFRNVCFVDPKHSGQPLGRGDFEKCFSHYYECAMQNSGLATKAGTQNVPVSASAFYSDVINKNLSGSNSAANMSYLSSAANLYLKDSEKRPLANLSLGTTSEVPRPINPNYYASCVMDLVALGTSHPDWVREKYGKKTEGYAFGPLRDLIEEGREAVEATSTLVKRVSNPEADKEDHVEVPNREFWGKLLSGYLSAAKEIDEQNDHSNVRGKVFTEGSVYPFIDVKDTNESNAFMFHTVAGPIDYTPPANISACADYKIPGDENNTPPSLATPNELGKFMREKFPHFVFLNNFGKGQIKYCYESVRWFPSEAVPYRETFISPSMKNYYRVMQGKLSVTLRAEFVGDGKTVPNATIFKKVLLGTDSHVWGAIAREGFDGPKTMWEHNHHFDLDVIQERYQQVYGDRKWVWVEQNGNFDPKKDYFTKASDYGVQHSDKSRLREVLDARWPSISEGFLGSSYDIGTTPLTGEPEYKVFVSKGHVTLPAIPAVKSEEAVFNVETPLADRDKEAAALAPHLEDGLESKRQSYLRGIRAEAREAGTGLSDSTHKLDAHRQLLAAYMNVAFPNSLAQRGDLRVLLMSGLGLPEGDGYLELAARGSLMPSNSLLHGRHMLAIEKLKAEIAKTSEAKKKTELEAKLAEIEKAGLTEGKFLLSFADYIQDLKDDPNIDKDLDLSPGTVREVVRYFARKAKDARVGSEVPLAPGMVVKLRVLTLYKIITRDLLTQGRAEEPANLGAALTMLQGFYEDLLKEEKINPISKGKPAEGAPRDSTH